MGQRSVRRRPSLPQISRHACRAPTRPYFPALKSALSEKSTRAAGGAATERRSAGRDGAGRARRCAALCRAVRRCAGRGCRCVGRGDGAALRAVGLGGGCWGQRWHCWDLGALCTAGLCSVTDFRCKPGSWGSQSIRNAALGAAVRAVVAVYPCAVRGAAAQAERMQCCTAAVCTPASNASCRRLCERG